MSAICSRCTEREARDGQRWCARCHSAYERKRRADRMARSRQALEEIVSELERSAGAIDGPTREAARGWALRLREALRLMSSPLRKRRPPMTDDPS